ncbi:MAG TPA: DUF5996 family protein [Bryobacteraceae bacterium]|jgi:hypothetical protein|nr:DUF5996 family protein [Bryobacteraceae bacterium]
MSNIVDVWPELPLEAWQDTYGTLHMWAQIVGKIRKTLTPLVNHWWNVTLYVTPRGLTTSIIPYQDRSFDIAFDFIDHKLDIRIANGAAKRLDLAPRSVADFYADLMSTLHSLGIDVKIQATPDEVANPIPFAEDRTHKSYNAEYAHRFWRILVSVDRVFKEFRGRFIGKCSPVHFFWGSFDLAVTRFSGRRAPERPGADAMTREAYSYEVSSAGFWPGGGEIKGPAFYSYMAPEPSDFKTQVVRPKPAFYHAGMSEFFLMYDDVRRAESPDAMLLEFMQSTYEAGANLAKWDRAALEREPGSTVARG